MIGILIVAHGTLGDSLAGAVTHVLGSRPPQFDTLQVAATDDPLQLLPNARERDFALILGRELGQLGRGARVEPQLVDDLNFLLLHRSDRRRCAGRRRSRR